MIKGIEVVQGTKREQVREKYYLISDPIKLPTAEDALFTNEAVCRFFGTPELMVDPNRQVQLYTSYTHAREKALNISEENRAIFTVEFKNDAEDAQEDISGTISTSCSQIELISASVAHTNSDFNVFYIKPGADPSLSNLLKSLDDLKIELQKSEKIIQESESVLQKMRNKISDIRNSQGEELEANQSEVLDSDETPEQETQLPEIDPPKGSFFNINPITLLKGAVTGMNASISMAVGAGVWYFGGTHVPSDLLPLSLLAAGGTYLSLGFEPVKELQKTLMVKSITKAIAFLSSKNKALDVTNPEVFTSPEEEGKFKSERKFAQMMQNFDPSPLIEMGVRMGVDSAFGDEPDFLKQLQSLNQSKNEVAPIITDNAASPVLIGWTQQQAHVLQERFIEPAPVQSKRRSERLAGMNRPNYKY